MPLREITTQAQWSVATIGETAGQVWQILNQGGKTSITTLERDVDAPAALTHMAIGWLAREGKISIQQDKRAVQIWLTQ